eukprot:gene3560-7083_t
MLKSLMNALSGAGVEKDYLCEKEADVLMCRLCSEEFMKRMKKRLCELCKGIFCENCIVTNAIMRSGSSYMHVCRGCFKGETPGENVRNTVSKELITQGINERHSGRQLILIRHTFQTSTQEQCDKDKRIMPSKGYFEFTNKSNEMCCIKIVSSDFITKSIYETIFPSYRADSNFAFDTHIIPRKNISPCASVQNFKEFVIYRGLVQDKNVLINYRGDATCTDQSDFITNIENIELIYRSIDFDTSSTGCKWTSTNTSSEELTEKQLPPINQSNEIFTKSAPINPKSDKLAENEPQNLNPPTTYPSQCATHTNPPTYLSLKNFIEPTVTKLIAFKRNPQHKAEANASKRKQTLKLHTTYLSYF